MWIRRQADRPLGTSRFPGHNTYLVPALEDGLDEGVVVLEAQGAHLVDQLHGPAAYARIGVGEEKIAARQLLVLDFQVNVDVDHFHNLRESEYKGTDTSPYCFASTTPGHAI